MWVTQPRTACARSKCHKVSVHCGVERTSEFSIRSAWAEAWSHAAFRIGIYASAIAAVLLGIGLPIFFGYIGNKPGSLLNDPVLDAVGPVDVTWISFTVLYGMVVLAIGRAVRTPWILLRGLHAYALMMVLRMFAMYTVTLEAPLDIIPLIDPVTSNFYPGSVPFSKDLFFSGHTATIALLFCISTGKPMRSLGFLATIAIGVLVIVQHVHWTVDVLAAPLFVWLAWKGSALTLRLCGKRAV